MLEAKNHLSPGLNFPVSLIGENIHLLPKFLDFRAYVLGNRLMFEIYSPLLENTLYKLHKITPIPRRINNNSYAFFNIKTPYIAVDLSYQNFITFSEDDYKLCKQITSDNFLCTHPQQTHTAPSGEEFCEIALLKGKSEEVTLKACRDLLIRAEINHITFFKLRTPNTWAYINPVAGTPSRFTCREVSGKTFLGSSGRLQLGRYCKLYVENIILSSVQKERDSTITEIIPKHDILLLMNNNYSTNLKVPPQTIKLIPIRNINTKNDLSQLSHEIDKFQSDLDNQTKTNYINKHDVLQFGMLGMIFIIIIGLGLYYKIYKKCVKGENIKVPIAPISIEILPNTTPSIQETQGEKEELNHRIVRPQKKKKRVTHCNPRGTE